MSELTPELINSFSAKLQKMKQQLEAETRVAEQSSAIVELDQQSVGRLSRMDALQAQEMALELARRRQQTLIQINAALVRIAQEDFGYCRVCEELIDIRRLEINPVSRCCIRCADKN